MLCQQNILSLLKFPRLLTQACGTLQLASADLLDVNLIWSLNGSHGYNHQGNWTEITYISETESPQASPGLSQELVLGHAFRPKSLNSAVDNLKSHRRHNELPDSRWLVMNNFPEKSTNLRDSDLLQGALRLIFIDLQSSTQNQQSGPFNICP